jgi:hypothetical protein
VDILGVAALGLVAIEWLAMGWLSGVGWPSQQHVFWAPRWALRLLVGAFLVALAQLVLASIGLGIGSIPLVLVVAAIGGTGLRVARSKTRCTPEATKSAEPNPRTVGIDEPEANLRTMAVRERVGWLLLGAVLLAAAERSFLVPEAGWDAFSHWGLRAQAYALAGTIVDAHSEHEYYPPLVPLLEAWLYVHRGSVSIDLGRTVWALVGSAFAVCLGWHLRLNVRQPWQAPFFAAGIVLITVALIDGFWTGQADLALTAFLSLGTLAVVQWQISHSRQWLLQVAIFAAAAALTKFEGLPRIGVLVAAVLIEAALARNLRFALPALIVAGAAGLATGLWTAFELTHGITPNAEHIGQFQPLALGSVVIALIAVFGGVRTGGGLLVAALAWVLAGRQLFCPPQRLLTLVVLGQLLATLVAFLLSSTSPDIEVRTSATRLFEQFLPLALYVGAVTLSRQTATYNRRGR